MKKIIFNPKNLFIYVLFILFTYNFLPIQPLIYLLSFCFFLFYFVYFYSLFTLLIITIYISFIRHFSFPFPTNEFIHHLLNHFIISSTPLSINCELLFIIMCIYIHAFHKKMSIHCYNSIFIITQAHLIFKLENKIR